MLCWRKLPAEDSCSCVAEAHFESKKTKEYLVVAQESRGGTCVKHTIKNLGGDSVILIIVCASLFLLSLRLTKTGKTFSQESRGACDFKVIKTKVREQHLRDTPFMKSPLVSCYFVAIVNFQKIDSFKICYFS